jgi:hypothetical protein
VAIFQAHMRGVWQHYSRPTKETLRIVRLWHGRVAATKAEAYREFLARQGRPDVAREVLWLVAVLPVNRESGHVSLQP